MKRLSAILASSALLVTMLADAGAACANGHIHVSLGRFAGEAISRPLYWGVEGQGKITTTVRVFDATCDGSTFQVH